MRSTAQHVAQNLKRERLTQQNAEQCRSVLRCTVPYCAALLLLCKPCDQIHEYLFILAMTLQAERLIETVNKYEIL